MERIYLNDLFQKDNNLFTLQTLKQTNKKNANIKSHNKYTQLFFFYVSLSHDETTRLNSVS